MNVAAGLEERRTPRFRRAAEPPPFRLTDDDVEIVRVVARHRLIISTHIAELVGRSLDRTNNRLMRLSMQAISTGNAPSSTASRVRDQLTTSLPIEGCVS